MVKLILLVLALLAVYLLFRPRRESSSQDGKVSPTEAETMVACAYCGVHVPRGEAVLAAGRCYCCDEHRQRHAG